MRSILMCAFFVTSLLSASAFAACGDTIPTPQGGQTLAPPVVTWDDSLAQAQQIAKLKSKPFGVYFASKEESPIVGENADVLKAFMKENNNSLPETAMIVPRAVSQLRDLGVGNFVKIKLNKENRALAEQMNADVNTMVICAPAGDRITSVKCTSDLAKTVESAKREIAAWSDKK